jgi:hypothetical protein
MLIYSYAIYLTLHDYIFLNNFFKIKQLREDKNKMENQEILILKKIKNQKENPTQKIDKNKRKGGKRKSHCQNK